MLANKIIAVSHAAARRFAGCLADKKMEVIYNSVNLETFSPETDGQAVRNELAASAKEGVVIGTIGMLVHGKGQDIFLDAAAEVVKSSKEKVVFLVVGEGDRQYTKALKQKIKDKELEDHAVLTGFRKDIPEIIAALDIFVLYTRFIEGFSRVVVEAMAAQKPVITTDLGGNSEAVSHNENGILLPMDNDANKLAKAMLKLIEDSSFRHKLAANARIHALKNFSIEENLHKVQNIYDSIK